MAFYNLKANFLHTLLSVLGIVIGVAALVAILSLIDGMEKYARDQIEGTSSLNSLLINVKTHEMKDGIRVPITNSPVLRPADMEQLAASLSLPARVNMLHTGTERIRLSDTSDLAAYEVYSMPVQMKKLEMLAGRYFSEKEYRAAANVAVINIALAEKLFPELAHQAVIGNKFKTGKGDLTIVGLGDTGKDQATFIQPISRLSEAEVAELQPVGFIEAEQVESLLDIQQEVTQWLEAHYQQREAFDLISNHFRLEQLEKAMLVFRIVMGLITGISVLVGGIGIMNVLLIAVTERTREIGIRKATGARPRDIIWQFLSESITIASFGSFLGLVLGLLAALGIMPIINHFAQASFSVAFSLQTLLIISGLAMLIGIVFGTYPALRASRLDPVEAIRHE